MDELKKNDIHKTENDYGNNKLTEGSLNTRPNDHSETRGQQDKDEKGNSGNNCHIIIQSVSSILLVICTIAIAVITFFYTQYASKQVGQMKEAVEESRKMREGSDKSTSNVLIEMGKQSNAMQKFATALEKTDETSRLRDRAYVYFSKPFIFPYPSSKPIVWAIGLNLRNNGNMPARLIAVRYGSIYREKSIGIVDPFPFMEWTKVNTPKFIGPQQEVILQHLEIPINVINQAIQLKVIVFICMEIKYTDGFDMNKTRITQMSRILRFDDYGGFSFGYIGTHNCTDDDCD